MDKEYISNLIKTERLKYLADFYKKMGKIGPE